MDNDFDISINDIKNEGKIVNNDEEVQLELNNIKSELDKKKRVITKLDPERLLSKVGLPNLIKSFENYKSNGKGNELKDLTNILDRYKIWQYQMISVFGFEDCIGKLEALGHKREIKTALNRYRNDDKIDGGISKEFVDENGDEDKDYQPTGEISHGGAVGIYGSDENDFDEIVKKTAPESEKSSQDKFNTYAMDIDEDIWMDIDGNVVEDSDNKNSDNLVAAEDISTVNFPKENFTEEQKRIQQEKYAEENRQKALAILRSKQNQNRPRKSILAEALGLSSYNQ